MSSFFRLNSGRFLNSYMKVEGAQEIIAIQIKEEDAKTTVEAVVPEASGD